MNIFGDKKRFAISYTPFEKDSSDYPLGYCHFIFKGTLIGNPEEPCLLETWTEKVQSWRNNLEANKGQLSNPLFQNLTEREIFEIIVKSNQLPEDFDPTYEYLPSQQTNDLWLKHYVRLDETIDAFSIVIIENGHNLKLIWTGWRYPSPENDIGIFFSLDLNYDLFFQTLDSCLNYLSNELTRIKS